MMKMLFHMVLAAIPCCPVCAAPPSEMKAGIVSDLDQPSPLTIMRTLKEGCASSASSFSTLQIPRTDVLVDIVSDLKFLGYLDCLDWVTRDQYLRGASAAARLVHHVPGNEGLRFLPSLQWMLTDANREEAWRILEEAWNAELRLHSKDISVLINASVFYRSCNLRVSLDLLDRGRSTLEPDHSKRRSLFYAYLDFAESTSATGILSEDRLVYLHSVISEDGDRIRRNVMRYGLSHALVRHGKLKEAARTANDILASFDSTSEWACAESEFYGHLALGQIALAGGDTRLAGEELILAVSTSRCRHGYIADAASKLSAARGLIQHASTETVMDFLLRAKKVWPRHEKEIEDAQVEVLKGGAPRLLGVPLIKGIVESGTEQARGDRRASKPGERFVLAVACEPGEGYRDTVLQEFGLVLDSFKLSRRAEAWILEAHTSTSHSQSNLLELLKRDPRILFVTRIPVKWCPEQ